MRVLLYSFIVLMTALLPVQAINQTKSTQKTHAISMHQDVKYPKDFKHFGGVNPKAPKGGTLKLGVVGTFDSTLSILEGLILKRLKGAPLNLVLWALLIQRILSLQKERLPLVYLFILSV